MQIEVAIPLNVHQTFTYRVPEGLRDQVRKGCRVVVPFGRQMLTGYVVECQELAEEENQLEGAELKEIEELLEMDPVVTDEVLGLTKWIAEYYYAPWGEVIKSSLPAGINVEAETMISLTPAGRAAWEDTGTRMVERSSKWRMVRELLSKTEFPLKDFARDLGKARAMAVVRELERLGYVRLGRRRVEATVKVKRQQAVRRCSGPGPVVDDPGKERPLSAAQQRVLEVLDEMVDPPSLVELLAKSESGPSVVRTLERRGYLEIFTREVRRDPLAHLSSSAPGESQKDPPLLNLTPEQSVVLGEITTGIAEERYAAFLLHGVTGSGKTEVYIRAMHETLRRGRSALMLVPEISLTPMFARRLKDHFGEAVAILHSSLSEGERLDEWNRLRRGEARVCIGARSAVFAPLVDLGLIVVDEEHEGSYKQDESPRYHGRDTAVMRAHLAGAVVIIGSATPSMESYYNAQSGKYRYLRLAERIGGRQMARVEMVDMRLVFARHGKQQVFSDEMKAAIEETRSRGEQTIVLLNRRGFSSFTICRSCGHTAHCPNCDVTLTFHRDESRLVCHYCNHHERVPQVCPDCQGPYIFYVGEGTEQIEALLKGLYPEMRIARLDRDTTRRRGAFEKVLGEFGMGEIDLLVGTQMIAKGHDFHNVTLVCVISVDAALGMPDFRSAERAFQLLTQVAGRAGRGDKPGRVLIQSYHTEHYALQYAAAQDYDKFYEHEIHYRQEMRYPPFALLINLLIRHPELPKAAATAAEVVRQLKAADREKVLRVLGPAPAPLARIRGEHRLQVLIKTRHRREAREALDAAMNALRENGFDQRLVTIDMDPVSLM
jgi:primosomal protein N' (replication factor Y) (superfamily II helicase)